MVLGSASQLQDAGELNSFYGRIALAASIAALIGVGEQEAYELLLTWSWTFYGLAYLAIFAIPLLSPKAQRNPSWIVAPDRCGLRLSRHPVFVILSIFPIIDVTSQSDIRGKFAGVVLGANVLGWIIYRAGQRKLVLPTSRRHNVGTAALGRSPSKARQLICRGPIARTRAPHPPHAPSTSAAPRCADVVQHQQVIFHDQHFLLADPSHQARMRHKRHSPRRVLHALHFHCRQVPPRPSEFAATLRDSPLPVPPTESACWPAPSPQLSSPRIPSRGDSRAFEVKKLTS